MSGSRIPLKPDQGPDRTAAGASVTAERQLAGHPSVWAPTPQSTATAEPPAIQTWRPEDRSAFLTHIRADRLFAAWRLAATTEIRRARCSVSGGETSTSKPAG